MEVLLDGRDMVSREAVHDLLTAKLKMPDYYGRNLDALYDALGAYPEHVAITLVHAEAALSNLGNYAKSLIKTFEDASAAFSCIDFFISNEII